MALVIAYTELCSHDQSVASINAIYSIPILLRLVVVGSRYFISRALLEPHRAQKHRRDLCMRRESDHIDDELLLAALLRYAEYSLLAHTIDPRTQRRLLFSNVRMTRMIGQFFK